MEDKSGFYKKTGEGWFYAPNFVYSKSYTLEKNGNRDSIDGWFWCEEEPLEYIKWKEDYEQTI